MNAPTSLQPLRSLHEAFRQCRIMVVLVTIILFFTFGVIGAFSIVQDAFTSYIAERFRVTVFFKPGITPDKTTIEHLRALSEINEIKLIPSASAPAFINKHAEINNGVLTKGISPELFPFTLLIQFHKQHLGKVSEVIELLNKELQGIQEIRYAATSLKESLENINRIETLKYRLTLLIVFVSVAGCLSVLSLVISNRKFWFQYSLSGLVAGIGASLLLFSTGSMISTISAWQISLQQEYYCVVIFAGLFTGITGDLYAGFQKYLEYTFASNNEGSNGDKEAQPLQEVST